MASNTQSERSNHSIVVIPGIPEALKNFDSLPDSANVRLPVVQALFCCSPATVWRMVKSGRLPQPRRISERVTAWNVGMLRKTLAA